MAIELLVMLLAQFNKDPLEEMINFVEMPGIHIKVIISQLVHKFIASPVLFFFGKVDMVI